jgi:hypothetical protein
MRTVFAIGALILAALGVVDDDIADDYCASDEALAAEYERFAAGDERAAAQIAEGVRRRRTVMHDVLRCVRTEYGDARGYLARLGVRHDALDRLGAVFLTGA